MNAITIYEPPPKPDQNTIIFLRAFIGTSSPFHKLQVEGNVIPFPMAYPREVRYLMRRFQRSQPARTPKVIELPAPEQTLAGKTIPMPGFAQQCTVTQVVQKWGETRVQVSACIGKHHMIKTVKLSELEVTS